jgi:hypothetical protein
MRRFLTAVLFGVLAAAVPTAVQAQYAASAQSQAVVADWYNRYLHRAMGAEAVGWAQDLDQGQDPTKLLAGILGSDEYYIRCGSTIQGYISTLFADVTGRQATAAEYNFWLNRLAQIGGAAPDYEQRLDVAYEMLMRYPQGWQGAAPTYVAPTYVAPTVIVPPVYNYGRRYGDHDDYEYRRPYVPAVRWDRDHRDNHDRDHRDNHDRDHRDNHDRHDEHGPKRK